MLLKTIFCSVALLAAPADADWQPAAGPLSTRWTKLVRPDYVLPDYPRPQMVRRDWKNLNGLWNYAFDLATKISPNSLTARYWCRSLSNRRFPES